MRISDWSSDVCSSDLASAGRRGALCYSRDAFRFVSGTESMSDDRQGRSSDSGKILYCSFCGKSQHEVRKLIAGPSVFICDECVELCNDIIREELEEKAAAGHTQLPKPREIRRSEEHTSELQSLMRISYAVFCLKKKKNTLIYT